MLKKWPYKKIVLFTTISLLGLILTQSFWVFKAVNIGKKQFYHRANIALEDVLEELVEYKNNNSSSCIQLPEKSNDIFCVLDTTLLKDVVGKYVRYHELGDQYFFQIIKSNTKAVVYSSNGNYKIPHNIDSHKACLSCVWKKEYYHLALYFPNQKIDILLGLSLWLSLSIVFILIVIGGYIYNVSIIIKQKKISEMKNDFINNMTHEFKTPLSTISIASEVLKKNGIDVDKIHKYADIIFDENLRMQHQVERVLQIAQLDKDELTLTLEWIDIHDLIRSAVDNLCLEHCQKEINLEYKLEAKNVILQGDKLHLTNIFKNLVDNASKYSGENSKIIIETKNVSKNELQIDIIDNGIGISQRSLQQIFDKFYRVPTGNVHDVKGFGLGLYYVKTMVEAHGGVIFVESELNKGSVFSVVFPLKRIENVSSKLHIHS